MVTPIAGPAADVVADTRTLSRDAWLALRRHGLGGSDAATVLGLNPYAGPMDLYLDKLGLAEDRDETEAMFWGHRLEPVVADRFADLMPFTVQALPQMLRSRAHPFMLANIDRVLTDPAHPERGPGILECKAPGFRQNPFWSDETAPDPYLIQVQHYLAVTGFQWAYLAALIGGQRYVVLPVERDEAVITPLIAAEQAFWTRVTHRQPPPLDGSPASSRLLKQLHPRADGTTLMLGPEAVALAEAWDAAHAAEKAAAAAKSAAATQLQALLGDAATAQAGPYVIRWANRTRQGLDSTALQQDHPELVARYRTVTSFRSFSITTKEARHG